MILCRECGNSAPSRDGFCSSCGALLDWSGERVETQSSQAAHAAQTTQVLPVIQPAATPTVPQSAPPAATPPTGASQPFIPAAPFTPHVPPPNAESAGRLPTAEARRAEPVPVPSEHGYTGPYCQGCGVRNPQDRRFCRACGTMLQLPATAATGRRGWWRRFVDRLLRRRGGHAAGDRPAGFRDHSINSQNSDAPDARKRRGLHFPRHIKLGRLAPVLIIAGLAGIGLGPARTWVSTEISTLFGRARATVNQHYTNVTPVGASASSEAGHGAGLAVDGLNNTYWASSQHPDGAGDTITVTFASPVDIDQIGILSGADAKDFRASGRPHDLVVTVQGASPVEVSLDDSSDFQSRAATLRHVTTVTITVKDAYPGQKHHDLAIRDLEFFVKSS
ncbi:MAG: NADase-type glycan-binding domain-containing protein [Actinocrinis sp.]